MAKVVLDDVTNIFLAVNTINANNAKIETAMENTLSRDGTAPNEMNAHLDMNNHRIYNLSAPVSPADAVRLQDLQEIITDIGDIDAAVQAAQTAAAVAIASAGSSSSNANSAANSADDAEAAQAAAEAARDTTLAALGGKMDKSANLGDVFDAAASRSNIGLAYIDISNAVAGTNNTSVMTPLRVHDHLAYNTGLTRSQIPTRNLGQQTIIVSGETAYGDYGAGAMYVRGTSGGLRAIQDAAGTWWNLSVKGEANAGHFGAVGDGLTDDTAAIQLAIDTVCPFIWQGTTRSTELNARSGSVYIPKGRYLVTSVLRLAPNLTIRGDGTGNDWSSRSTATGGSTRDGTAIVSVIGSATTYAIDTAPYADDGVRRFSTVIRGLDSFNGIRTEVQGIALKDISFIGNWNSKGLNMAGAVKCVMENVVVFGFHVGVRWSASWYSSMKDVRIMASWKGIMAWYDVTDLNLYNVSILKHFESPGYNDTTEAALPPTDAWWTLAFNNYHAGIVNYYSNIQAYGLTIEGFNNYSQGYNAVNNFQGVYIEGISVIAIISKGPDQQHEKHSFDTVVSNTCDLIACQNSRLYVEGQVHNYTAGGFNNLFYDVVAADQRLLPVVKGFSRKAGETFTSASQRRDDVFYSQGTWTPLLRVGTNSAGTQTTAGAWYRVGNLVTITGVIQSFTKGVDTGALNIANLPFKSVDRFGFEWASPLAFGFNAPATGSVMKMTHNSYELAFPGKTDADISTGADLRFNITYQTDEFSYFGFET